MLTEAARKFRMAGLTLTVMIERKDVFNINFYKKEVFNGSFRGMRYRIAAQDEKDSGQALRVTVWPGPYNYDTTPDAKKKAAVFPFSEEGLTMAVQHLNLVWEREYQQTERKGGSHV